MAGVSSTEAAYLMTTSKRENRQGKAPLCYAMPCPHDLTSCCLHQGHAPNDLSSSHQAPPLKVPLPPRGPSL